jgi:hypothetical protein
MIWKLNYFLNNPRLKYNYSPLIKKIKISQNTILSNYTCLSKFLKIL